MEAIYQFILAYPCFAYIVTYFLYALLELFVLILQQISFIAVSCLFALSVYSVSNLALELFMFSSIGNVIRVFTYEG
jgi:hypothetical protein